VGQRLAGQLTGAGMNVSLEQAIEIYAEVLKRRHTHQAPRIAREHAMTLKYWKDHEGHDVWLRVAETAERLLEETPEPKERVREP
jgi:hypothetical protein